MNLSFAGCGFLGIYHVGVATCFKQYAPHLLLDKISGASFGAIAACCLLCDMPLGDLASNVLRISREARKKALGPFSPLFNIQAIILDIMNKHLPNDAHIRLSGRLFVSMTRVYDGKNVIVSQFNSREDVMQALLATAFVPLFSGFLPPRFHGIRYMDGGFSDNLPTLDENTVTISPFCGESDICPRDISSQLFHVNLANTSIELSRQNIYRFARILFPPNPEILAHMCTQGFEDALRFLQRNNLINCTRCVAVQSTCGAPEPLDDSTEYDPECNECKIHRQEALAANLPETIMTAFQDAIDSANKGIINWLFKHKSVKLLSILSIPYTLPFDVIYATLNKILTNSPKFPYDLVEIAKYLSQQISIIISRMNIHHDRMSQTIGCQLTITEYDSDNLKASIMRQKTDLNLALQYNERPWSDNVRRSSCVINMNEFSSVDDAFGNILQVTSDQDALRAYYYMDENKRIRGTEIFDIADKSIDAAIPTKQTQSYDDVSWDEPAWFAQNSVTQDSNFHNSEILTTNTRPCSHHQHTNKINRTPLDRTSPCEVLSDASVDESNIFSDPESEWTPNAAAMVSCANSADSRPEVDQPTQ